MTLPVSRPLRRSAGAVPFGRPSAGMLLLWALLPLLLACTRTPASPRAVVGTWVALAQVTAQATAQPIPRVAGGGPANPGTTPATAGGQGTPPSAESDNSPLGTPSATIILASPEAGSRISATLAANVGPDGQAVDPTTIFAPGADKVYLVFNAENLKPDSHLEAVWIAEQVQIQVPANYEIDRSTITVQGDQIGNFSLARPNPGFPLGRYRVDLFLDGALIGQFSFAVRVSATPQPATPQASATATSPAG